MAYESDPRTLYVGNLHKNVTEKLLYELFLQAGPLERVCIPKSNSQNFRYGFVTYVYECAIDYAIELYKGTHLYHKKLVIKKKGTRKHEPKTPYYSYSLDDFDEKEQSPGSLAELDQWYMKKQTHQTDDLPGPSLPKSQRENFTDFRYGGYKRQRCERYKPYDINSRRENPSGPVNFNKRNRRRNRSRYNKSRRERRGGRF